MPERITLHRTPGWRKPAGAIVVARGTGWGNPYTVAGAIENEYADTGTQARKVAVEFHRAWLLGLDPGENDVYRTGKRSYDRRWMREHLPDLTGRDLACWCGPEDVCHADTLIAIANGWDEAGRTLMNLLHPGVLKGSW